MTKKVIEILLVSLLATAISGCAALDGASTDPAVPRENLPEGFRLLAALPEMDPQVNMTSYITGFLGEREIGPVNVSVGIYQWGRPGESYDAKVTLLVAEDESRAESAMFNYRSQPDYQALLARGVPIFGNATINGHETLEIKDIRGDGSIRYLYLWRNGNVVALVEGNADRAKSMELASATGL